MNFFGIGLVGHRTVGIANAAGGAKFRVNVSGSLVDLDLELAGLSFDADQVCVSDHLDIKMPADLDQFGGDNSHGAFIGGEGLVELCHYAAYGRGLLQQVDVIPGVGQIQGGLHPGDATAHH